MSPSNKVSNNPLQDRYAAQIRHLFGPRVCVIENSSNVIGVLGTPNSLPCSPFYIFAPLTHGKTTVALSLMRGHRQGGVNAQRVEHIQLPNKGDIRSVAEIISRRLDMTGSLVFENIIQSRRNGLATPVIIECPDHADDQFIRWIQAGLVHAPYDDRDRNCGSIVVIGDFELSQVAEGPPIPFPAVAGIVDNCSPSDLMHGEVDEVIRTEKMAERLCKMTFGDKQLLQDLVDWSLASGELAGESRVEDFVRADAWLNERIEQYVAELEDGREEMAREFCRNETVWMTLPQDLRGLLLKHGLVSPRWRSRADDRVRPWVQETGDAFVGFAWRNSHIGQLVEAVIGERPRRRAKPMGRAAPNLGLRSAVNAEAPYGILMLIGGVCGACCFLASMVTLVVGYRVLSSALIVAALTVLTSAWASAQIICRRMT